MGDPVAALVAILLADAATAAQAGIYVAGGEMPPPWVASMPRKAIVLRASGGVSLTGGSSAEHDTQRVDLFAYGPTPREAEAVRAPAALALRRVRRQVSAGTLIHWVNSAGGFSSGREPVTEWPRAFQSFQVFHALESVS